MIELSVILQYGDVIEGSRVNENEIGEVVCFDPAEFIFTHRALCEASHC